MDAMSVARSVFQVLHETVQQQGDRPALHQPKGGKGNTGQYTVYSWTDYRAIVMEVACGLHQLGVSRGDVVALQSETRAEFYFADLGVMAMGGIAAALYTSYPIPDQIRNLRNAGAKVMFIEDAKTMAALVNAMKEDALPLEFILLTDQVDGVRTLADLRALGRAAMAADPGLFEKISSRVQPEDTAILYLTSGATGEPKMGLVSHGAITLNLDMGPKVLPLGPDDRALAFLPSAHIAQRVVMELLVMRFGMPVWFSESLARMPMELRTVKPTFLLAPPRVWERIFASIRTEVNKKGALTQRLFHGALGLGLKAVKYRQAGQAVPGWISGPLAAADKLVFSKLRERLGNSLRIAISGAAPLGKDTAMFFDAIGMPIIEGYGLTEAGVLSMNPWNKPKYGTIGVPLPGIEMKLSDDGEIIARGPTIFSGYFKDEAATASVIKDGWFYTGDLGAIDENGYFVITGRKKEILVSSSGKKLYPARVEALFKGEPLVSQMVLIGDRLPFATALFTINPQVAETVGSSETVEKQIRAAVKTANAQLPEWEQIRKFTILPRDFTIDRGELTPTMKVRRAKVLDNWHEEIQKMYGGKEETH
jgi:long-chain acyl-CoA synthetase